MTKFCILCANGNDLPEGKYCRGCGREGRAFGLGAAVIKARGRQEPPTTPVAFDGDEAFRDTSKFNAGFAEPDHGSALLRRAIIREQGSSIGYLRSLLAGAANKIEAGKTENLVEEIREFLRTTSPDGALSLQQRVLTDDQVEWVVNDIAELGVKIGNQFFWLYKGRSLVYGDDELSQKAGVALNEDTDPPTKHMWRPVFKREFGECAHPINYADPKLIGTVSLDDSEDWKPLPAAPAMVAEQGTKS